MMKTFRILYVNIVRCVAHLVSSYLLVCLSLHAHHRRVSNCERFSVCECLLQGCIHVKQNQHASTTANTTFLFRFCFAGSHFASAIIMLYFIPCNISRLRIEKLLIKFSNIKPKLSSLRFLSYAETVRYSILFSSEKSTFMEANEPKHGTCISQERKTKFHAQPWHEEALKKLLQSRSITHN